MRAQGYRVLHRPWAFVQWLPYAVKLPEDYVLMAEPDHIFLHVPPLWCAIACERFAICTHCAYAPWHCADQNLWCPSHRIQSDDHVKTETERLHPQQI